MIGALEAAPRGKRKNPPHESGTRYIKTTARLDDGSRNPQISAFNAWFGTTILCGSASFVSGDVSCEASHAVMFALS